MQGGEEPGRALSRGARAAGGILAQQTVCRRSVGVGERVVLRAARAQPQEAHGWSHDAPAVAFERHLRDLLARMPSM